MIRMISSYQAPNETGNQIKVKSSNLRVSVNIKVQLISILVIFVSSLYNIHIPVFFLTLFCELTQVSGLYGIYPAPYRIFDINDLMFNTLGGVLGHIIAPSLTHKLPEILR